MRHLIFTLLLFFTVGSSSAFGQSEDSEEVLLYYWHFNDWDETVPVLSDYQAEALEPASITHTIGDPDQNFLAGTSTTDINAQFDEESVQSLQLRHGASPGNNGNHLQIDFLGEAYENLVVRYAARRTSTGFTTHRLEFDGEGEGNYQLVEEVDLEEEGVDDTFGLIEVELPEPGTSDALALRIVVDGASYFGGLNHIDNLTIHGTTRAEENEGDCPVPEIAEAGVDEEERTITLEITDPSGLEEVHFANQETGEPALNNLQVASAPEAFDTDDDVYYTHEGNDAPVKAAFELQATEMDEPVEVGYYVTATNTCGASAYVDPPHRFRHATGEEVELEAFPNPFGEVVTITYVLPEQTPAKLQVFDLLGRPVTTLFDERQESGEYALQWTGQDGSGHPVAAGMYILRLEAAEHVATHRLVRVR